MAEEQIPGAPIEPITTWLAQHTTITEPLNIQLITGGRSNLTFAIRDSAGRQWVLRRPPLEVALASAHDVLREYRIVTALGSSAVPTAPTIAACNDTSVIGSAFALYRYVAGPVLHTSAAAAELPVVERNLLGFHVIDVLADLHMIDPDAVGLGDLGPREGYIERQIRRWSKQWDAQSPRRVAAWDAVGMQLQATPPHTQRLSIVHGDYRLGNMIIGAGHVQALLDWELCTLGDPLADLAYLANNWIQPGEQDLWGDSPTKIGGFPALQELLERYTARTGLDLTEIDRYRAFAQWRLAAILEGVGMPYTKAGPADKHTHHAITTKVEKHPLAGRGLLRM